MAAIVVGAAACVPPAPPAGSPHLPPSVPGPGPATWAPALSCSVPNAEGIHGCTAQSTGLMDLYENPANFAANYPHGTLHLPSTQVAAHTWAQGNHYNASLTVGQSYIAWKPTSGPAAGKRFLLVPFGPNVQVNTGFPDAYSIDSSPTAPHYSDTGPGSEWTYTQSYAWAAVG